MAVSQYHTDCFTVPQWSVLHIMQAAATSVAFLTGSQVLASTGLDEQLLLLDRRANRVAASASPGGALHAMACRDNGSTIAVGTTGKRVA